MSQAEQVQPGCVFDGYQVDSVLGRGANATVYLAQQTHRGTWHALKVLHSVDSRRKMRIEQEAIFRDELRHPNIVPATEAINVYDHAALVMDFVEGPSLVAWLDEGTPDLLDVLALFRGIVAGVHHAHSHQVIHRDLKPSNVLLQPGPDQTWVPRISDFGLAKALSPDLSRFGGLTTVNTSLGTAGYAAPEQIRDASGVDSRADLYSLGCILYEMICGVAPFAGLSTFDTLTAQVGDRYTDPATLAPGLPPDLYTLIRDLMRSDPDHRIQGCDEVLQRVDQLLQPLAGASVASPGSSRAPVPGLGLDGLIPVLVLCGLPLFALVLGSAVVFLT